MVLISPGLKINELDFSETSTQLGLARLVVLGAATKGEVGVLTDAQTVIELERNNGLRLTTDLGLQGAVRFLRKGNNLGYLRVADGTETVAATDVVGPSGGAAAVAATGTVSFTGAANPTDGETVTMRDGTDAVAATGTITFAGATQPTSGDTLTIFDNLGTTVIFGFVVGGDVTVALGADAAGTRDNLIQAINASALNVSAADTTTGDPEITITHGQPGTVGNSATLASAGATPPTVSGATLTGGSDGTAFTFEFDDDASFGGGNIGVLIGATAAATLVNLINAVNSSALELAASDTTVTIPEMTLTHNIPGDTGNQTITEIAAAIGVTGLSGGTDAIPGAITTLMSFEATSPGTWANTTQVDITATAILGAPADNIDLVVRAEVGTGGLIEEVERFSNLSLDSTDPRFIELVLLDGIAGETFGSQFIRADVILDGTPTPATITLGVTTAGTNGIPLSTDFASFIGTVSGNVSTGLKSLRNTDLIEFNLLAIPGISHTNVINEMLTLASTRGDFLALIDPPLGLDRDQVVAWHNGTSTGIPNAPTNPLDNSYGALFWSWQRVFDDVNKINIFLPPSGFVAANAAVNDDLVGPWFPFAGHNRGIIEADESEFSPDQDDRDVLVGGQNRVNPISNFLNQGPTIFGNRTLLRKESALNSLHIRRMLLHAEKLSATSVKFLIFEPNSSVTWRKFELLINPILEFLAANQGLEEFRVIVNESTNPPEQRQKKRMRGRILIKPLEAAEIIEMDFAIFATGAEFIENI